MILQDNIWILSQADIWNSSLFGITWSSKLGSYEELTVRPVCGLFLHFIVIAKASSERDVFQLYPPTGCKYQAKKSLIETSCWRVQCFMSYIDLSQSQWTDYRQLSGLLKTLVVSHCDYTLHSGWFPVSQLSIYCLRWQLFDHCSSHIPAWPVSLFCCPYGWPMQKLCYAIVMCRISHKLGSQYFSSLISTRPGLSTDVGHEWKTAFTDLDSVLN